MNIPYLLTPSEHMQERLFSFKRDHVRPAAWELFDLLVTSAITEACTRAATGEAEKIREINNGNA